MMKQKNLLFGAVLALSAMIAACTEKDETVASATQANAEKVVGTYEGYSLANSAYFQNNFTADEQVTVAKASDNTVNLTLVSNTWGTSTIEGASVTANGSRYTLSGNGTCTMTGMGGAERTYDCSLTADIASLADATVTVSLPAVMGGSTVVFKTGKGSTGYYVADTYRGDIDVSVNGSSQLSINDTVMKLTAEEGDKVSIITPEMGLSMGGQQMSLPSTTFEGIAVTTADYQTFTIGQQPVSITVGSTTWSGTVEGTVNNGVLSLTFVVTPGAMPMPITITFTQSASK